MKLTRLALPAAALTCMALFGVSASAAPVVSDLEFISGLRTAFNPMVPPVVGGPPLTARKEFEDKLVKDSSLKREGLSNATVGGYAGPGQKLVLGGFGATITSDPSPPEGADPWPGEVVNAGGDPLVDGRYDTTGDESGQWWLAAATFTIDFNAPIEAFGFYLTDAGDFLGSLGLRLKRQDGTSTAIIDLGGILSDNHMAYGNRTANANNGWLQFVGFYDENCSLVANRCYTQLEFILGQTDPNDTNSWDYLGFDDLTTGKLVRGGNVPEPGSLALVGASLLGLGAVRRRRQR